MSCNESNEYHLSWNDHMSYVRRTLTKLLAQNELVDVTLCCEGGKLFAHKMLLSVCSHFFLEAFKENPCSHPIVILKGINYTQMKNLLKFMYDGEVSLEPDEFESFLKTAKLLEVYGLTECEGIDGFKQNSIKLRSDVESSTQSNTDTERVDKSNDNTNIKVENIACLDINASIDEKNNENIDTIEFAEMQLSPQYETHQILELHNTTDEMDEDQPSTVSLHFHRCYSSTTTAVKRKFDAEAENRISETRKTRLKPSEHLKCSVCTKMYTHVNSLRQHMKVHTEGAKCSVCGKVLCRRYQLKVHLKKQHGIDFTPKSRLSSS